MLLVEIDRLSTDKNKKGYNISITSKLLFFLFMLTSIIVNKSLSINILILALLTTLFIYYGISIKLIFKLSLYPLFFGSLFGIIQMSSSLELGVLTILKSISAAWSVFFLITTTPYIDLFSTLNIVLPSLIIDIFFFAYRSIFILIEKGNNLIKIIKLRGGLKPFNIIFNIKNIAGAIGVIIINGFDISERMYNIYHLRGYKGGIKSEVSYKLKSIDDIFLIILSLITFIGVTIYG